MIILQSRGRGSGLYRLGSGLTPAIMSDPRADCAGAQGLKSPS